MGESKLILTLVLCFYLSPVNAEQRLQAREFLANLASSGYDAQSPPIPTKNATGSTEITVSLLVQRFSDLDLNKNEIGVLFYLSETWIDPRLSYSTQASLVPSRIKLNVNHLGPGSIWLPDTFIENEVPTKRTDTNRGSLTISADGKVIYSRPIATTILCGTSFMTYPSLETHCILGLESYTHTRADLDYKWETHGVVVASDGDLRDFRLKSHDFRASYAATSTGEYSRLKAEFVLERNRCHEWLGFYLPTAVLVIFSWISFWIHSDHLSAKAIIGSTALILLFFRVDHVNREIPSTTYIKSIDYWTGFCFFIVLLSLLELAIVAYLAQRRKALTKAQEVLGTVNEKQALAQEAQKTAESGWNVKDLFKNDRPLAIDVISRIIFPILFVILVIIYLIIA